MSLLLIAVMAFGSTNLTSNPTNYTWPTGYVYHPPTNQLVSVGGQEILRFNLDPKHQTWNDMRWDLSNVEVTEAATNMTLNTKLVPIVIWKKNSFQVKFISKEDYMVREILKHHVYSDGQEMDGTMMTNIVNRINKELK